uniref:Lipase_3 domain-containing protein n=1 Tax=Caenorhabditis japonica TaxID=281687 RepID=A0A8R1HHC4_CAEJA
MSVNNNLWWILFIILLNSGVESVFNELDGVYNDTEVRYLFEMLAAVHSKMPDGCINSSYPNPATRPVLIERFDVRCDVLNSKCTFGIFEIPNENRLVVAIRGTQSMSQFFFEFISFFIPDTSFHGLGEINFYFWLTHQVVWDKVSRILTDKKFINHDVIFIGHSLGASLTALSAFEAVISGVRNSSQVKVISLAEPRTGNLVFAKNYNSRMKYSFRVLNGIDVLAHLPPCHKDYRFWPRPDLPCDSRSRTGPYHHSTEIWYPNGMHNGAQYVVCSGSKGEEMFCSNKHQVTVANFGKGITDHRKYFGKMVRYNTSSR